MWTLDRLHGHGVHALGQLSFIDEDLLAALLEEARRAQPPDDGDRRRSHGPAGDVLAALAVSRELRVTVSTVLGASAADLRRALNSTAPDRSSGLTSTRANTLSFSICCSTTGAVVRRHHRRSRVFCRIVDEPAQTVLKAGEGLLLNGRGTLHCWAPLGDNERRTLVAIGYEVEPRGQPASLEPD